MTDNDEGKFVADTIQEQKLRNHFFNRDFAILYRTNAQSRAFEEALRRMGIAYTMYGGISFYQRKEIKDYVAYLRVLVNPRDEEALKRIINYPARGIGKTTIDKVILVANEQNLSMWEVLCQAAKYGFRSSTLEVIENFVTMIRSFGSMLQTKNAYEVAVHIGKQTNIVRELFNDKSTEGVQRYENIQELLNSIKEWVDDQQNRAQIDEDGVVVEELPEASAETVAPTLFAGTPVEAEEKASKALQHATLAAYLQQITLLTDADEKDTHADTVKLMTIHAAKGLEFPCVFAAGLEEMLFPNAMSINTREELEEERRLFYVVITRAKQKLWITYANTRYKFGQVVQNEPSRFIDELPESALDRSFAGGGLRNQGGGFGTGSAYDRMRGWGNDNGFQARESRKPFGQESPGGRSQKNPPYLAPKAAVPRTVEHIPSSDFKPSDPAELREGQKVEHQKFGFGEVVKMEGASHNPIATIRFEKNGEKKIMLQYAKLRIVQ
jgi:DNA helicase-2/ATP-dependent DNA helicase PcrA